MSHPDFEQIKEQVHASTDPEILLKNTALVMRQLDTIAGGAEATKDKAPDRDLYVEARLLQARLIANLLPTTERFLAAGEFLEEKGRRRLTSLSIEAEKVLDMAKTNPHVAAFRSGGILKPDQTDPTQPNELEKLISELYPPKNASKV